VWVVPSDLQFYDCSSIRSAANSKLGFPVTLYQHAVYVGPVGWICESSGLGSLGGDGSFAWVVISSFRNLNTLIHELGHNLGFLHSNSFDGTTIVPYADESCQMGLSLSSFEVRRGFNAVQLFRWGVLDSGRFLSIASSSTNFQGRLFSVYSAEDAFSAPLKLIELGTGSNVFLSFRGVAHSSFDRQVDAGNSLILPSYSGRVLVHVLEADRYEDKCFCFCFCFWLVLVKQHCMGRCHWGHKHRSTEFKCALIGEHFLLVHYKKNRVFLKKNDRRYEDEFCHVTIGPAQPAAPSPPSVQSADKIEANVFASTKNDISTIAVSDTCYMTGTGSTCVNTGEELFMFGADNNHSIFVRLPIRVPRNSVINVARLVLEASFAIGSPEFWNGMMDVVTRVEGVASGTSLAAGNPRLLNWTHPTSSMVQGQVRGAAEVEIDVKTQLQFAVNQGAWNPNNYVSLQLSRGLTSPVGAYRFANSRRNLQAGYFASPRLRIEYSTMAERDCVASSTSLVGIVTCIRNQMVSEEACS
jgi:hypothetical protein